MTEINSMPIKVMYDEDSNPFVPFVSLEAIGEINGENINEILDAKLEADNIKAGNQIDIELKDGDVIIHNSATGLTVVDNLETENPGEGALDARQGKVLKDSIPEVVNNLNTIDSDKALSAHQGYILAGRSVPVGGAEGQVLKKSADNDYALEWGDAADPNAIIGDGSIKKIVELTYNEYIALKDLGYLDSETEYHINDWTESGHSEIKAEQVFLSSGENVEMSLQSKMEGLIVNVVLNPADFSVISTSHYSEDIINAHQEGKKVYFHIDYTNGTCISTLDLIEGTSAISQLILRMYNSSGYQVFLLRLVIGPTQAQLQRDQLLTDDDVESINDSLEAFALQVAEHVDERFESQGIIDDGQNTRLDIAEGNIDAIVNTVNGQSSSISNLTTRFNNLSNTVSGNIMTVYSTSSSKDDPRTFTFSSGLYLVLAQVNGNHMGRVDMVYGAGSSIAGYTTIKEPSSNVFFEYNTNSITISSNYTCMIRILRMP